MINIIKYAVILVTASFLFTSDNGPGPSWTKISEKENVSLYYKWRHSNPFIPDSPLRLKILIKNDNPYRVTTEFAVDYYYKVVHHETSGVLSFCVNPESVLTGRFRGLVYSPGSFTNKEIMNDLFELEISGFVVEKDQECRLKINWMGINEFLSETDTSYVE